MDGGGKEERKTKDKQTNKGRMNERMTDRMKARRIE
jgi:hypothetical protein